jgi:deoxyribodipyrimidine photo-lyase
MRKRKTAARSRLSAQIVEESLDFSFILFNSVFGMQLLVRATSRAIVRIRGISTPRTCFIPFAHFSAFASLKMPKHARSDDLYDAALSHPSTKRAKEVDQHTPMEELIKLLEQQKAEAPKTKTVLHWFRSKDLRISDNKALHAASTLAKKNNAPLITAYLHSPKDLEWHGTSAARSDFIVRNLKLMKEELEKKHIPLAFLVAEERVQKKERILDFVREHDVSHIFANIEYEVDELRRDIAILKQVQENGEVLVELLHDQTVVVPGTLKTGSGGPHKVFTPYHKVWLAEVAEDPSLIETAPVPYDNDEKLAKRFKELFDTKLPGLPENKQFDSTEEENRIRELWPAGHDAGIKRLNEFLKEKVELYAAHRSEPAVDCTSRLSAYFSAGVVSVREALSAAKDHNDGSTNFDSSSADAGLASWVREIVFREFYRQMMVVTPHNAMNLPQNLKFDFVEWEDDEEGWRKWCEGKTGVPFVSIPCSFGKLAVVSAYDTSGSVPSIAWKAPLLTKA